MTANRKSIERQILKDPVAALVTHDDAIKQHATALNELSHKYLSLKQQNKNLKIDTNIISRKIGDAKTKGDVLDGLKATMQQQCARLESNTHLLQDIEKQIFSYFDIGKILCQHQVRTFWQLANKH